TSTLLKEGANRSSRTSRRGLRKRGRGVPPRGKPWLRRAGRERPKENLRIHDIGTCFPGLARIRSRRRGREGIRGGALCAKPNNDSESADTLIDSSLSVKRNFCYEAQSAAQASPYRAEARARAFCPLRVGIPFAIIK